MSWNHGSLVLICFLGVGLISFAGCMSDDEVSPEGTARAPEGAGSSSLEGDLSSQVDESRWKDEFDVAHQSEFRSICNEVTGHCLWVQGSSNPLTFASVNASLEQIQGVVAWGDDTEEGLPTLMEREVRMECRDAQGDCGDFTEKTFRGESPLKIEAKLDLPPGTVLEVSFFAEKQDAGPIWTQSDTDTYIEFSGFITKRSES